MGHRDNLQEDAYQSDKAIPVCLLDDAYESDKALPVGGGEEEEVGRCENLQRKDAYAESKSAEGAYS